MAENKPTGEVDSVRNALPRRQSKRIQSKKKAEKERQRDEKEDGHARKRKTTNASARKVVEADGVGVALKKEAGTKDEVYIAEKEMLARRRVELLDDEGDEAATALKRRKVDAEIGSEAVQQEQDTANGEVLKKDNVADDADSEVLNDCGEVENGVLNCNVSEKRAYAEVKEKLRLYNKHYLHFVQEEEKRCRKEIVENKSPKGSEKAKKGNRKKQESKKSHRKADLKTKSKKESGSMNGTKRKAKRPDLKAATLMKKSMMVKGGRILNLKKRIGKIPGIRVGHQFFSRTEMVVLEVHDHWLSGIDYMGKNYQKKEEYKHLEFPLAIAIVLSGMYEDDEDKAEEIVYTGQGGHDLTGDKRQKQDQKLEKGNLALKSCIVNDVPVRVIRGHENQNSYTGKIYTYDGLYKVIEYWPEKGISGFTVYKFKLRRVEGQPKLTTDQVRFAYGRKPQSVSELRGLACEDITGGQEIIPIPATNLVDDTPVAPSGYKYTKSIQVEENVVFSAPAPGCSCKGNCMDPNTCACANLNGGDFPYVHHRGGRLIEAKDVVYECSPNCGCGPDCINRVSQRGLKYHLEVFRTPQKGWAVRSWDPIPSGAPVCEYIGILKKAEDLESVLENNYIFDIDCLQTMRGLGGREKRSGGLSTKTTEQTDPEFCIDAGSVGNVARFINHSCEPNLFVQCVLSSHHDMKLARVVLFAADNIPALQELTYDYGYALDSVHGPDGEVKKMPCYCGAGECRNRLF